MLFSNHFCEYFCYGRQANFHVTCKSFFLSLSSSLLCFRLISYCILKTITWIYIFTYIADLSIILFCTIYCYLLVRITLLLVYIKKLKFGNTTVTVFQLSEIVCWVKCNFWVSCWSDFTFSSYKRKRALRIKN